jgi:hypothetical protein
MVQGASSNGLQENINLMENKKLSFRLMSLCSPKDSWSFRFVKAYFSRFFFCIK